MRIPLWTSLSCFICCALLCLSCSDNKSRTLLGPSELLGAAIAEEAASLAGTKKGIVLLVPDSSWGPASTVQKECEDTLKKLGYAVSHTRQVPLGDPMRSEEIGLKAADFIAALQSSSGIGAIVSLVGPPLLKPQEFATVPPSRPPFLVVSTASLGNVPGVKADAKVLERMLEAKIIQLAIIDGSDPHASDAKRKDFSLRYRILRAGTK